MSFNKLQCINILSIEFVMSGVSGLYNDVVIIVDDEAKPINFANAVLDRKSTLKFSSNSINVFLNWIHNIIEFQFWSHFVIPDSYLCN